MASSLGFSSIQDLSSDFKPVYETNISNTNKITQHTIQSMQNDMTHPDPERENNNDDSNEIDDVENDVHSPLSQTEHDLYSKYNEQYQHNYNTITEDSFKKPDELLTRLNYMIHLLEEQQTQKTDHVLEEIILYCFLGVFIIFTIDSFAKVGRYTR